MTFLSRPGRREIDGRERAASSFFLGVLRASADLQRPHHVLRHGRDHILNQLRHRLEIGVGPVGLEHGELGIVAARDAFVAEIAVDLEDLGEAADEQPLEVEFRRDPHVEIDAERVVLGDKRTRGGPAREGLHHGRLDLGEFARLEKAADFADDFAAEQEHATGLLADDEIDVALAITLLHIGEAVPLARNGPERLRENFQIGKTDCLFAGLGGEERSFPADEIAEIEELPGRRTCRRGPGPGRKPEACRFRPGCGRRRSCPFRAWK